MAQTTRTADVQPLMLPRPRAGRGRLAYRLARRLVRTFVRWGSVTFFARHLDDGLPAAAAPAGFEVREASEQDLGWLALGANPAQHARQLRSRFRRGDRCFVAVDPQGRAAHVRWVTTRRAFIPELDLDVVLRPDEVYFYDGYTRPDARGQGIDGLVRRTIFRAFRDQGARTVWSYVRSDNAVGQRAAERWQSASGSVRYLTVAGVHTFVRGERAPALPILRRAAPDATDERVAAWRDWFEGWLDQPLTRRSTGFHALPPEYFASAADYLAATLRIDPAADSVLDVGCDSAMVSRLIVDRCRQFTGVDFIAGMLADARRVSQPHTPRPLWFVASDGRHLPFGSGSFQKAYCSAVIHTLPSHADGLAVIRELVRVCRPGGQVLVASVPDVRKRRAGRRAALRRAPWRRRPLLVGYWLIPDAVKPAIKRALGRPAVDPMAFLEYDLAAIGGELRRAGLDCRVLDFPADYWSEDFRTTRSNLLISIPQGIPAPSPVGPPR
jgi:SAM-dependent methyltransferase/ribosomal protein S18 acetylase RimI-like enzyme